MRFARGSRRRLDKATSTVSVISIDAIHRSRLYELTVELRNRVHVVWTASSWGSGRPKLGISTLVGLLLIERRAMMAMRSVRAVAAHRQAIESKRWRLLETASERLLVLTVAMKPIHMSMLVDAMALLVHAALPVLVVINIVLVEVWM